MISGVRLFQLDASLHFLGGWLGKFQGMSSCFIKENDAIAASLQKRINHREAVKYTFILIFTQKAEAEFIFFYMYTRNMMTENTSDTV